MKFSIKTVLLLFVTFIFCFLAFSACGYINGSSNETEDSFRQLDDRTGYRIQLPQSFSGEIFVSDGWLYYCDTLHDGVLYAYGLDTKEKELITDKQGTLYKTCHGGFYLIGSKLYEIKELGLVLLCELPEDGRFVDYYQNKIYWTGERRLASRSYECDFNQYLYVWDMDSEGKVTKDSSECIYDISATTDNIVSFMILGNAAYLGQTDGMYLLDCATKEVKCIFEREVMGQTYTDGEYIVFKGRGEDGGYWLYAITMGNDSPQQIWSATGTFAAIKDGILYFDNPGLLCYDLSDGSEQTLSFGTGISGGWGFVDFFGEDMILRHAYGYDIYLFDRSEDKITCIISE